MVWRTFVAVGDSFTEGVDDTYPDGSGYRGWADLVAARLAEDVPGFGYANLAVRGRLTDSIVEDQVPTAVALEPDLVSFAAGGNDALRRHFEGPRLQAQIDASVKALRATGADVVVFRFANVTGRLPGRRWVLPRSEFLNRVWTDVADRYGCRLVDLWGDTELTNPLLWSLDRIHLNEYGHRRVAAHVLTALDVKPDPAWWESPAAGPVQSWFTRRGADARWARQHLAPWVRRRLTGRSSGDNRIAKRPNLTPPTS
jgi:lysophospholipase L1-like esterase